MIRWALAGLIALLLAAPAVAQEADVGKSSGYKLPRFVSIKTDEINLRVGPGSQYPIRWRLRRFGMPAMVVDEEGQWFEVVLHDEERGWLYQPYLSGIRRIYVTRARAPIFEAANANSDIVALAEKGVILRLVACPAAWCQVRKGDIKGWIARADVWGLLPDEVYE